MAKDIDLGTADIQDVYFVLSAKKKMQKTPDGKEEEKSDESHLLSDGIMQHAIHAIRTKSRRRSSSTAAVKSLLTMGFGKKTYQRSIGSK
eukprot:30582_1